MQSLRIVLFRLERLRLLILATLAGLLLLAGLVYSAWLGDALRYLPDEEEYVTLAQNLAQSGSYSLDGELTAYRPPGYAAVLSLVSLLGGEIFHFRLLNFLLMAGSLLLVGRFLSRQGYNLGAVISGLLVVAYPVLFYSAGTLYPQTLAAFLFLLVLDIYTRPGLRSLHHLVGGALFGLLVLTVPTFFYAFIVIAAWLWFYRREQLKKYLVLSLGVMLLVLGFWTARNYAVFDTFTFVSTNSGENLLVGNSENTTPNAGTTVNISKYLSGASGLDEVERDGYFRQQALEYITSHPGEAARLYVLKVLNYFNFRNELVTRAEATPWKDILMLVTYGPLLVVFLLRLLQLARIKLSPLEVLLSGLYLTSALVSAIFFTRIRFRLPFDYLLIMAVAIALEVNFRRFLLIPIPSKGDVEKVV